MAFSITQQQAVANINVKNYGAVGNGTADDTAAITAALAAATGGSTVYFPPGTYLTTTQTLLSGVNIVGAGFGTTTIKLKNSTNADLFSANTGSIALSGSFGSGSNTGVNGFTIRDLTLDGNKANQSSGTSYTLRFYGYGYIIENVAIINGFSGGMQVDWNPTSSPSVAAEAQLVNVRVYNNNKMGIEWGGPSDSQWTSVNAYLNATINIHICPNAGGIQANGCHTWNAGTGTTVGWLVEAGLLLFSNSEAEGEGRANMVILGDYATVVGGAIYAGDLGSTAAGIVIGQAAGQTPITGQILQSAGVTTAVAPSHYSINTTFHDINVAAGCITFANDGSGKVDCVAKLSTGGVFYSGTPNTATTIIAKVDGITGDGTAQKSGGVSIASNSFGAFTVTDTSGTIVFQVDTFDSPPNVNFVNTAFNMLDGSANNLINFNGGFVSLGTAFDTQFYRADVGVLQIVNAPAWGVSATTPDPGAAGTITTANVGIARVTPASARTGCILQAGTVNGQQVILINNGTVSITFAAAATSHVALGTSAVLAANGKLTFVWDSVKALWY